MPRLTKPGRGGRFQRIASDGAATRPVEGTVLEADSPPGWQGNLQSEWDDDTAAGLKAQGPSVNGVNRRLTLGAHQRSKGNTCIHILSDVDVDDEGWIAGHAQHLWSLGALVEESPGAAAAVGLQLRRQSDQLRASLSNVASLVEAEEALAAEKGDAQQELLQGGGVRFVWGSSLAARQEREHIKSAQGPRHDGTCYRCFRCVCYYCGCCGSSAGTAQDSGSVLTLRAAAKAVSEAADDCISLLAVEPGAPGVTPGASALRRAPADTDRESLRSAVQQLDAACRAMLAIDGAVDQDREDAEDVLRAFMDIGGAEDGTIAVGTLYRALTELGDERTVLLAEDIGEIVQMCKLDIDGGLGSTHPDTSEQLPVRACLLPHALVCPCGACQPACVPGCADPFV